MVPPLYAGNRKLGPTLWTDNLGTGIPCDGPLGAPAHGQQVQTTEGTHETQVTLRYQGTSQGTK